MRSYTPRDSGVHRAVTYTPKEPERCHLLTRSARLCDTDIAAIVGVAVFIWYIVWGIPLTRRAYWAIHAKLAARRKAHGTLVRLNDDIEKAMKGKALGPRDSYVYADPFFAPTKRLQTFLHLNSQLAVPERAYQPRPEEMEQIGRERQRLDSFKFPPSLAPSTSSPEMQETGPRSSYLGLYPPPCPDNEDASSRIRTSLSPPPGLSSPRQLGPLDPKEFERLQSLPVSPPPVYLDRQANGRSQSVSRRCSL
ncbi:hypothetical protein BD413DRAFT_89371 [Trametes elegans]|nr:hypothetical protein BD413DRAFT_89371 [Trametes elegans]